MNDTHRQEIVRLMIGRELTQDFKRRLGAQGKPMLRVSHLSRGQVVHDVSFEAMQGEILGFAGLMGSGRTETMRALFGSDRGAIGQVFLQESSTPVSIESPRDAVRHGIALLTEDRKDQGLLLPLPVRVNISLARLKDLTGFMGWINRKKECAAVAKFIQSMSIRCSSPEQRVSELSGGNQQKVVIARWLYRDCDVMIFDEPTRGIDVAAKFDIYQLLADFAIEGKSVIVVSSDLKELMMLCDRIGVMSAGRLVVMYRRDEWSRDKIISAALSGLRARARITS